ncbi:MAG: hypothetical protein QNJ41_24675 [Xenococcaceae cyanobacterium MO_188.B32]|nr:hypothetical protein [Xenococcaceae cyanobacterium MO_188.B32]
MTSHFFVGLKPNSGSNFSDKMRFTYLAGPEAKERLELFDFIVEELRVREALCPHRIRPVRTALLNQREDLLAFAQLLDGKLDFLVEAVTFAMKETPRASSMVENLNSRLLPLLFLTSATGATIP